MNSHIVTGDNNVQGPHNPPHLDGGDRQDGAVGWMEELREDLLDSYEENEHAPKCVHPYIDNASQVNLLYITIVLILIRFLYFDFLMLRSLHVYS